MESARLLDFGALIGPIPGDNPAGAAVPFAVREKLEELRKEVNPDDYRADDPQRPSNAKRADWAGIVKAASDTLSSTSKDLGCAARLTEALVKLYGFAGLRDGVHVLRELVEQCWDRLYPPVEDGDLEIRAAPFFWLDDTIRGARFPHTVRMVPLVSAGEGKQFGRFHWDQLKEPKAPISRDDFEKAAQAAPLAACETVAQHLAQSREELAGLTKSLNARFGKLGSSAPGLIAVREAVDDCHSLILQILQKKRPEAPPETDKPNGRGGESAPAPAKPATTRADLYRQLSQAANVLRELEPHSPIPYLILRAVELGNLPFPDLIKDLVRDAKILAELNREFGIKEAAPANAPAKK
jgi:type VI secretion system protein ImpA